MEKVWLGLVLAVWGAGVYMYDRLPLRVASHWNMYGQVDGYSSRFWGAYGLPIGMSVLAVVLLVLPRIDPKRKNIVLFRREFDQLVLVIMGFLAYVYGLMMGWNGGIQLDLVRWLIPGLSVVMYMSGKLMARAKPNWTAGIRTPWTLADDGVWEKTHQVGSRWAKAGAIVILAGWVVPAIAWWVVVGLAVGGSIALMGYSYWEYRKLRNK